MKDTTTIVIGVGLLAGAVYLATRKDPAPAGDVVNDGAGGLCGKVGVLDKKAGAACSILDTIKDIVLPESECSRMGGFWGAYTKADGYTGGCSRQAGSWVSLNAIGVNRPPVICCGRRDGKDDPRCKQRPKWGALPERCTKNHRREAAGIRDHRTGTAT